MVGMTAVTLRDVAARAGVDISTASRALSASKSSALSAHTVTRVVEAAEALDYRANTLARGLRTNRTYTVGMLVPDLTNPFFPPIVRGIEDELLEAGYTLILANTDNDPDHERAVSASMLARQIDGLIVASARLDVASPEWAGRGSTPLVLVNRWEPDHDYPWVVPDDRMGVRAVIEHLVGLGHSQIAHIAGPSELSTGNSRYEAYRKELRRQKLPLNARLVSFCESFSVEAGAKACTELIERDVEFTAIFAANDLVAIGCLDALARARKRVPRDVSLVGFNDMLLVDRLDPPMTTVAVPKYQMGRTAARLLLDRLNGVESAERRVRLPLELVVRRSTSVPKS
jgi:LacI family transcriptional regulator